MNEFVEKKINSYAQNIIDGSDKRDAHAMGELKFYMALRRCIKNESTIEDIGMLDAINDVLQETNLMEEGVTFLSKLKS
jgi:hypothetical protein